jgi:hypothetical protein
MSDSGLSPDEVRAVAEVHNELGPEYLTKALGTVWAIIAVIYLVYGWRLRRR